MESLSDGGVLYRKERDGVDSDERMETGSLALQNVRHSSAGLVNDLIYITIFYILWNINEDHSLQRKCIPDKEFTFTLNFGHPTYCSAGQLAELLLRDSRPCPGPTGVK